MPVRVPSMDQRDLFEITFKMTVNNISTLTVGKLIL